MIESLFPSRPEVSPRVYAYEDTNPQYAGMLKVGFTVKSVKERVAQQYPTVRPGKPPYVIHVDESAVRPDGTSFDDRAVHRVLKSSGILNLEGEWFSCSPSEVKAAILAVKEGRSALSGRFADFSMRPEQERAVEVASRHFSACKATNGRPHFLWNAKMRFGKTFAAYQLAKKMGLKKVLILTFKPAVQSAWEEDLSTHVDFDGWQFVSPGDDPGTIDASRPYVCFGSFQDYLGKSNGTIKVKNEWVHATHWDLVILDEYHYGAWRENAKDLFDSGSEFEVGKSEEFSEDSFPITADFFLYLSGTPFRAIASGEFLEDQIYNWTYSDEQRAKEDWEGEDNPYLALPRMVLMTYQMPESLREVASEGEFDEFDLNEFFRADFRGDKGHVFAHEEEVQKWLNLVRGAFSVTTRDDLRLGGKKPPMPFSDVRLLSVLNHTLWFLPNVASCEAMAQLLSHRNNTFYHDYKVVVAAGDKAGIGLAALPPVLSAMSDGGKDPLSTKTITLSCGKLTTGVTVRPWTGVFMLRNSSSPETYFQTAFRVQSPWTVKNSDGLSPNQEEILKQECYIFDFAPNRALCQIAEYSCRLGAKDANPEDKVQEFIGFLPVLAYDGSAMHPVDAAGVLDMAMSGTTATLLARRWECALLVNVDNDTLKNLMASDQAMKALESIEGFRGLGKDIETVINRSESVNSLKKQSAIGELAEGDRRTLTEDEKEYKSLRKKIQVKLIKFAARIPVFMYLTDYREQKLPDVISGLDPSLFRKVTGLTIEDFELLVGLNVFNSAIMNDAIYKFRRYEDSSLAYTGLYKHEGEVFGGWDTQVPREEVMEMR